MPFGNIFDDKITVAPPMIGYGFMEGPTCEPKEKGVVIHPEKGEDHGFGCFENRSRPSGEMR